MKRITALFVLTVAVMLAASFCAQAFAQADQSQEQRVVDIRVRGNNAVSTATILTRLKIQAGDVFDEGSLNKELKRLYATGYFADVSVETEERPEGVVITFIIMEKPIIKAVEFRGNARVKTNRIQKKVDIKEGQLLDYNILAENVAAIDALYTELGYSRATINYKIETDPETGEVTVVFDINEGAPLKIRSIEFDGNEHFTSGELSNYMTTKTAWWFIRKGSFDEYKFEADLDRIRSYYRSKGFLDAQVTSEFGYSEDGQEMHITVIVNEGPKYLVGDVSIQGELGFPEIEIKRLITVVTGDPLDHNLIRENIENIRTFYYDKGYMNAEVDLRQRYNSVTDRMDLTYNIVGHNVVYVGKINVLGNTKTKDKVIRRELRVFPGAKYDGQKLKYSKERIYNLGFFEDVYFETVPTDDPDVKDLNITVKETKTGEFSLGGGYSSVDAFIGFVQVRQRNFDIMNFPTFSGSGQDIVIRAEVGSARTNYMLSWTDPWIFDYPFLFGFAAYRTEHERFADSGYDYDERRTGGSLKLGKELTDQVSTGVVYTLEEVNISNIRDESQVSQDLKDEAGTNWISRVTWNVQYDSRDNKYSPTKGILAGMSLENAGGFIGGDKDFVKGYMHTSYFYPVPVPYLMQDYLKWKRGDIVLELKGRGGYVEKYADSNSVPIYERFYAGGATTIRGYGQRKVGPRDTSDDAVAVGGNYMLIGNIEMMFPLYQKIIKGAVFFDIGDVWSNSQNPGFKSGAGIGVRVKTPLGPLQLDWGYPLNKNHNDKQRGEFYFSMSHGF